MNALVYNHLILTDLQLESLMVHGAYLLLNKTIAAGSTRQHYHSVLKTAENINEKLKFLETVYGNHEGFEDARRSIKLFRDFKKIKHPSPAIIAAHKKLQKALEAEYEHQTKGIYNNVEETNLISIGELAPHGYFDWFHIRDEKLEVPGEEHKHINAMDMLQLLPGQYAQEPFLFVLPAHLFRDAASFKETYHYHTALHSSMEVISFAHTCFELPNLLMFSPGELHAIKMQLQPAFEPFNKVMDRWLLLCRENNERETTIAFFRQEVLPAAGFLQTAISDNALLNHYKRAGTDNQTVQFSLGEISLCDVWQFLHKKGLIPWEGVWNELTVLMEEPGFRQRRPFLMLSAITGIAEEVQDENIPFTKKSLSVD